MILNGYWNIKINKVNLWLKNHTQVQGASYLVAELIAPKRKSHTVGENLIKLEKIK